MISTAKILVAIVQIWFEAKNWAALNDHIVLLSKRRYSLIYYIIFTIMTMICSLY